MHIWVEKLSIVYLIFFSIKKTVKRKLKKNKSENKSKTLSKKPQTLNPNFFYFYNENGKLVGIPYGN